MWMSDVPHDAHRSQDHRQTEDLCHERLRGAPQKQDAQDDTNDGDDPHERAETERCGPGMAEVSVLPEPHELERFRDQGADKSAGQTRGNEEKGEPQEIEVERPHLTKDDIENRHAQTNEEIRGDRPAHTTEEGQEDRSSVLASADAREAGKNSNRQRQETTDRKSEPSLRQGARRSVQGILPKNRRSIYFPEPPLDSSQQASHRDQTNIEAVDHRDAYRSADGTFTLSVQGGRTECDPGPPKSSLGSAVT